MTPCGNMYENCKSNFTNLIHDSDLCIDFPDNYGSISNILNIYFNKIYQADIIYDLHLGCMRFTDPARDQTSEFSIKLSLPMQVIDFWHFKNQA